MDVYGCFAISNINPLTPVHLDMFTAANRTVCQKFITKTGLYNIDPLKPHFYIVKLGFTGVCIYIFLISAQKIDCGYLLELPCRCGSNEYTQYMF